MILRAYALGTDWEWEREIAVMRLLTPGFELSLMTRVANGTLGGSEEARALSARPGVVGMAALRCGEDMAPS